MLRKIFQICSGGSSETVSSQELFKFLELVAELESGEDAVDPYTARLVVNMIMRLCGKEMDKKEASEEESDDDKETGQEETNGDSKKKKINLKESGKGKITKKEFLAW